MSFDLERDDTVDCLNCGESTHEDDAVEGQFCSHQCRDEYYGYDYDSDEYDDYSDGDSYDDYSDDDDEYDYDDDDDEY